MRHCRFTHLYEILLPHAFECGIAAEASCCNNCRMCACVCVGGNAASHVTCVTPMHSLTRSYGCVFHMIKWREIAIFVAFRVVVGIAMATGENESGNMCVICADTLADGSAIEAMACGHCFHVECISSYAQVADTPRHLLKCPVCKLTSADTASLEASITACLNNGGNAQSSGSEVINVEFPEIDGDNAQSLGSGDGNVQSGSVVDNAQSLGHDDGNVQSGNVVDNAQSLGRDDGNVQSGSVGDNVQSALEVGNVQSVSVSNNVQSEGGGNVQSVLDGGNVPSGLDDGNVQSGSAYDSELDRTSFTTAVQALCVSNIATGLAYDAPRAGNVSLAATAPTASLAGSDIANLTDLAYATPRQWQGGSQGFSIASVPAWDDIDDEITCMDCNHPARAVKSRVMNKANGKWRCDRCCKTWSQLYRFEGAGLADKMILLKDSERHSFFDGMRDSDAKDVRIRSKSLFERFESHEQQYMLGGAFKPLSVWATMGYDASIVESMSRELDIKADRMFGKVYRIPELTLTEIGTRGKASRSSAEFLAKKPKRATVSEHAEGNGAAAASGDPAADAAAEAENDADSSSNSDSSSDSSSTSDKKKKKKKKTKKGKKAKKELSVEDRKHKEKKRAAKAKRKEAEAAKAQKDRDRDAARAEASRERDAAKDVQRVKLAKSKQAAKVKTAAAALDKRLEKVIVAMEKSLKSAGAHLFPEGCAKGQLIAGVNELTALKLSAGAVAAGA
jgi:hypothetical protein